VRVVGVALFIKFEEVEGETGKCCRHRGCSGASQKFAFG